MNIYKIVHLNEWYLVEADSTEKAFIIAKNILGDTAVNVQSIEITPYRMLKQKGEV